MFTDVFLLRPPRQVSGVQDADYRNVERRHPLLEVRFREGRLKSLKNPKDEGELVIGSRWMGLAFGLAPFTLVKIGEQGVTLYLGLDLSDVEPFSLGQKARIDLGTADDADLFGPILLGLLAGNAEGLIQTLAGQGTLGLERAVTGQNDIEPTGKGLKGQGIPSRATHYDRLKQSQRLEVHQIRLQPPRNAALSTNDIITRASDDESDRDQSHDKDLVASEREGKRPFKPRLVP